MVLGVILNIIVYFVSFRDNWVPTCAGDTASGQNCTFDMANIHSKGLPFIIKTQNFSWLLMFADFVFWILVVLIILSLVRYFKTRKELGVSK